MSRKAPSSRDRLPAGSTATSPVVNGPCRYCGKQAEGHPGDYARCPHCGKMTKLPPDPPPGWRLVHRPGRLASIPYYMIPLFYGSILAIVLTGGGTGFVEGGLVIAVFAAWIFTIMRFGVAAEHQSGWWVPVVGYHLSAVLVPFGFWLAARGYSSIAEGNVNFRAIGAMLGSILVFFTCLLSYGMARGKTARLRVVQI